VFESDARDSIPQYRFHHLTRAVAPITRMRSVRKIRVFWNFSVVPFAGANYDGRNFGRRWHSSRAFNIVAIEQRVAALERASQPSSCDRRVVACDGFAVRVHSIRREQMPGSGEMRRPSTRSNNSRGKWNYSKKHNQSSTLQRNSDHDCVLFVQHPSEKARSKPVRSGSFIACAGLLSNCDVATEGGIPRSSR
jgi:hypothetical protein